MTDVGSGRGCVGGLQLLGEGVDSCFVAGDAVAEFAEFRDTFKGISLIILVSHLVQNHSNTSTKRPEELDMAQMGFFDVEKRYAALDAKHDPLVKINAVVPMPSFHGKPSAAAWRESGASQPTSVSRTQAANPGTPS